MNFEFGPGFVVYRESKRNGTTTNDNKCGCNVLESILDKTPCQTHKQTRTHTRVLHVVGASYTRANVINGRRIEVISLKYNLVVRLRVCASSAKIFSRILSWQRKSSARSFVACRIKCVNTILFPFFFFFFFVFFLLFLPVFNKLYYDYDREIAGTTHRLSSLPTRSRSLSLIISISYGARVQMRHGILSDLSSALLKIYYGENDIYIPKKCKRKKNK